MTSLVGHRGASCAVALCLTSIACVGAIGDGDGTGTVAPDPGGGASAGGGRDPGSGPSPASGPTQPGASPGSCGAPTVGPWLLRRLNRREYENTVRDLLGVPVGDQLPTDGAADGFDTSASGLEPSSALIEGYMAAAEKVAVALDVAKLVPCDVAAMGAAACASRFVTEVGRRAYRRPLDPAEVTPLTGLFARVTAAGRSVTEAQRLVLRALLQSPQFLYHAETSAAVGAQGVRPVSPHELASRLSYFLWGSMPDAELLAAADAKRLGTPDEVDRQARRLLADPKARATVASFHAQWLGYERVDGLPKDAALFPSFASVRPMLREETRRFVDHVFFEADATVERLLGADYSFVNRALAKFYGLAAPTTDAFEKTTFGGAQRAGLLTQASLLATLAHANRTSPTERGAFVRARLLCLDLPPPPPDAGALPEVTTGVTVRQRLAQHATNPACAACHRLTDPIGLGLEAYDAAGAFRSSEGGRAVDVSGELIGAEDASGSFTGGVELGRRLARSQIAGRCVAAQWFEFAHGRRDTPEDACSLQTAARRLADAGGDMRELLVAIARSDSFRNIVVESGASP
jgi:hypothetical protein